ncbi:MAG: PAS domain S-box protein, partial [Desulfatiglandales bacterium]
MVEGIGEQEKMKDMPVVQAMCKTQNDMDSKARISGLENDIPDFQLLEQALKDSEERYRMVADFNYDLETWRGPDGRYIYVSPSCERITGYSRDVFMDDPWLIERIAHPDDRERVSRHFREDFGEREIRHIDYRIFTRDGKERWISHYCQPVCGVDGAWLGRRCSDRDFTDRKRSEDALRESEAHHRAIIESFDGLIYTCSQDYRIEFLNQRFIDRIGYDAKGELCYKAIHGRDVVCSRCIFKEVFNGKTIRKEFRSTVDNRWYYSMSAPVYHIDGSISKQTMIFDITDRKEMEEAVKRGSERIKRFAYSVLHDLKNPVIGIYGLTKNLQKVYGETLDEKGKTHCDLVLKAAEEIYSLVQQINVYISTSEVPLKVESIDLKNIIQLVKEEFSSQLSLRRIAWSEPEVLPVIKADRIS